MPVTSGIFLLSLTWGWPHMHEVVFILQKSGQGSHPSSCILIAVLSVSEKTATSWFIKRQ